MNDADYPAVLNSAYTERAHLVALLAALYPSHIGHTDLSAPTWAVLTIELPTGQAAWHIAPADKPLFAHVQPTTRIARAWDGHTTDEKYQRIQDLADRIAHGEKSAVPLACLGCGWSGTRDQAAHHHCPQPTEAGA